MRLIDGDALKDHLEDLRSYTKLGEPDAYYRGETNALKIAIKRIDRTPTVDAVPVKHGRWKERATGLFRCSECDSLSPYKFKYCRECGADMRETKA